MAELGKAATDMTGGEYFVPEDEKSEDGGKSRKNV
jgi:hypothetical protein